MTGFDKIVADYTPSKNIHSDDYGKQAYSYSPCGPHDKSKIDSCDLTRKSVVDHPDYEGFGFRIAQGVPGTIAGSDFGIGGRYDVKRGKSISSNTDSSLGFELRHSSDIWAPCPDGQDESISL